MVAVLVRVEIHIALKTDFVIDMPSKATNEALVGKFVDTSFFFDPQVIEGLHNERGDHIEKQYRHPDQKDRIIQHTSHVVVVRVIDPPQHPRNTTGRHSLVKDQPKAAYCAVAAFVRCAPKFEPVFEVLKPKLSVDNSCAYQYVKNEPKLFHRSSHRLQNTAEYTAVIEDIKEHESKERAVLKTDNRKNHEHEVIAKKWP